MKITNYYPEAKPFKPTEQHYKALEATAKTYTTDQVNIDRANLLISMGFNAKGNPPLMVQNRVGTWINPYFVYKSFCQNGVPPEVLMEVIHKKTGLDTTEHWYEWCDYWLDMFQKGDHKKIRDNYITPYVNS